MAELKGSFQQHLAVQRISLCADILSKKGLTSYLGITAHFFGQKDHKRHHVTLAVQRFLYPHIGGYVRKVVQKVLAEWNIPLANVLAILTDNGLKYAQTFQSSFVESEDDKGNGDQEEKDAYEKEKGDREDKDVEESAT